MKIRKILRVTMLVIVIILAASGAGMFGAMLPNNMRHKYQDNVIQIEMVDERRDDEDELDVRDLE